jgi:hypothetical protein
MDTKPLASFAVNARLKLLDAIESKVSSVLLGDSLARREQPRVVAALENQISSTSVESVVNEIAYIWFNRLLVLTMLDHVGYNQPKAVTPVEGAVLPEVLQRARSGFIDSTVHDDSAKNRIRGLLSGQIPSNSPDMEAYGILLRDVCRAWGARFPLVFNSNYELADLLTPFDLLSSNSIRAMFVAEIRGEYAEEVETIGWLFQFYNSDVKKSAFEKFKSGKKADHEDLVAATQIFTPKAVAASLVENTIGTLWSMNYPDSPVANKLPAIAKSEPETTTSILEPQTLTVLDPACGSGNLLLSAYDMLEEIYVESGYNPDSIPALILSNNLHGLDIDPRSAALAAFAIWLRAARNLTKSAALSLPQPQVHFLRDSGALLDLANECEDEAASKRLSLAASAGILGSLVQLTRADIDVVKDAGARDGLFGAILSELVPALDLLSRKYCAVLANPPYMGPKNMPPLLKELVEDKYSEGKADLYGAFAIRCAELIRDHGRFSIVVQFSWVKLKRFADLRRWTITFTRRQSFQVLEADVFSGIGGFVEKVVFSASKEGPAVSRVSFSKTKTDEVKEFFLENFAVVEGTPFLFEIPEFLIDAMASGPTIGNQTNFNSGIKTGEKESFVRFRWEVHPEKIAQFPQHAENDLTVKPRWFPYLKGGAPQRWFSSSTYVVDWENDGERIRTGTKADGSKRFFQLMSKDFAFKPFITYSEISKSAGFRFVPGGYLTDIKSPAIKSANDMAILALLNSTPVRRLIEFSSTSSSISSKAWGRVPILVSLESLESLGLEAYEVSRKLESLQEISPDFDASSWIASTGNSLADQIKEMLNKRNDQLERLADLELQIDDRVNPAYGYPWPNFSNIDPSHATSFESEEDSDRETQEALEAGAVSPQNEKTVTFELISVAVGVVAGSISLGGQYTHHKDPDNIVPVLATNYFEDDLSDSILKLLSEVFSEPESAVQLAIRKYVGKPLRDWLSADFYPYHVKMYKNAPIYWMITSPKGHFKALTYIHRLSIDTFATCRTKYVQPLIERLLAQHKALGSSDPKKAAALEAQIQDIRELDDLLYDLVLKSPKLDFDEGVAKNHERFASVLRKLK